MRLGGFLGDWLKGPLHLHAPHWPAPVLEGVALHRQIDAWVDQQHEVAAAVACLGPRYRRLAPPVIDIVFDHFLARHFSHYHAQPLSQFSQQLHAQLARHQLQMPAGAQRFLARARERRLFERYAERETFLQVVLSLQHRLSRPALLDGIDAPLEQHYAELERQFHQLYPRLLQFAQQQQPGHSP